MNSRLTSFLCLLLLLVVAVGQLSAATTAEQGRVVFGVVPADTNVKGVVVERVLPGSPAEKAGLRAGDHIWRLNGVNVTHKDALRQMIATGRPGDVLRVQYRRSEVWRTALVELAARPEPASTPVSAVSTEQVAVPYEVSLQMSQARARIRHQLGALPYRMKPSAVVADLRELRNLALTLQVNQPNWMQGGNDEAELEYTDAQGSLMLHELDGRLTLIVRDAAGNVLSLHALNTPQECRALPQELVRRLQAL